MREGARYSKKTFADFWPISALFMSVTSFGLEKLVTRTFNLDEINKAIDLTAEGNGMKYMISP
jgi:Zn-dependent alcohol dehydrogenase